MRVLSSARSTEHLCGQLQEHMQGPLAWLGLHGHTSFAFLKRRERGQGSTDSTAKCSDHYACVLRRAGERFRFRCQWFSSSSFWFPVGTSGCTSRESLTRGQPSRSCCVTRKPRQIPKPCLRKRTDSPGFSTGRKQNPSTFAQSNSSRKRTIRETRFTPGWVGFERRQRRCRGLTCRRCLASN